MHQKKINNNKNMLVANRTSTEVINIYTQYLMKSTFETI
jgi:hypothetical protein